MKHIVKQKYLVSPNRHGAGLDVFVDFPKHVLHMKQHEKNGQYFLMYYSDIEKTQFEKACASENIITMYDNSYFEYKIEGKMPSMTKYVNDIWNNHPDIVMVDVDTSEYNDVWSEFAAKMLCTDDTLLMAIPHGDSLDELSEMISAMGKDPYIDIIGIPYIFPNSITRMDIIAHCVATGNWCWGKAVHMLGLAESNEIQNHKDLIRICQNIISIDTSYPVLLGCDGVSLTTNDNLFDQAKPSFSIVNCPTDKTDESVISNNIKVFKDTINAVTSGFAKIALVGAAGTGKTTTALKIAELLGDNATYLKYPPIHEVCDYRDPEKANLATAIYTGCNLMAAHIQFDKTVILDRCLVDNIAYAKSNQNDVQVEIFTKAFNKFCGGISSIGWTFPFANEDIEDDGKRITDRDVQLQMHSQFAETLSELDLNILTVSLGGMLSVEDRIELFLKSI
jgi:hypothetical protein